MSGGRGGVGLLVDDLVFDAFLGGGGAPFPGGSGGVGPGDPSSIPVGKPGTEQGEVVMEMRKDEDSVDRFLLRMSLAEL